MNIKNLIQDENAVSPVIGVILMVAITVILAAVIGTFVLGLGENVQDSAPQANFQFEYENTGDDLNRNDIMEVTHTGGEDVELSTVSIQIGSTTVYDDNDVVPEVNASNATTGSSTSELVGNPSSEWSDPISTGSTQRIEESGNSSAGSAFSGGQAVRIVWTSPSGGTSNTIGQSTVPT